MTHCEKSHLELSSIRESVEVIKNSGLAHEFNKYNIIFAALLIIPALDQVLPM